MIVENNIFSEIQQHNTKSPSNVHTKTRILPTPVGHSETNITLFLFNG